MNPSLLMIIMKNMHYVFNKQTLIADNTEFHFKLNALYRAILYETEQRRSIRKI